MVKIDSVETAIDEAIDHLDSQIAMMENPRDLDSWHSLLVDFDTAVAQRVFSLEQRKHFWEEICDHYAKQATKPENKNIAGIQFTIVEHCRVHLGLRLKGEN